MIGILLAIILTQSPATCTVTNLNPTQITCEQDGRVVAEIITETWPPEWGKGPHLTGKYNATIRVVDDTVEIVPVTTLIDPQRNETIRASTLREQRRWRRPALQQSISQ